MPDATPAGYTAPRLSAVSVTKASDVPGGALNPRRLIAIVFADMVDYSRLTGLDDTGTLRRLLTLRRMLIDPAIREHGGVLAQTAGDSLTVVFDSIEGAVRCAVQVQQQVPAYDGDQPPDRRMRFRISINIGDVIPHGTNLHGDAVNIAARLQTVCPPGGVCVSRAVRDHVQDRLNLTFTPLGSLRLKNIAKPVDAFVLQVGAGADPVGAVALPAPDFPRSNGWRLFAAVGAGSVLAGGVAAWVLLGAPGQAAKPIEVASLAAPSRLAGCPSVAVLPFRNLSGNAADDFFSDGTTEDVITALGRFSNLLVIAKSASFRFKDSHSSPADIGRALDVRYLLGGSVRRAGDRVRIGVELTEAATGRLVWSETYDAEVGDIFAVQDDIAKRVVGAAAVKITRFEQERGIGRPTNILAAYDYVLRGRDLLSHATRESNDDAGDLFQRAIDLDPNYADAYAALGGSHFEAVVSGWSEFRPEELQRAEALAHKALTLDPAATRAYRLLALVSLYRKRYDIALVQIDRALEINPSDAENFAYRGAILMWAGRAAESLPWLEGALRLDGGSGFTADRLCSAYYLLRRYAEAVEFCNRALSSNPGRNDQMIAHPLLAAAYAELGRQQEAETERAAALRQWPFLDARMFAAQFGTDEASGLMLDGLNKAGFH
jgi:TolB-like protein/class 3 adenylate cyclase